MLRWRAATALVLAPVALRNRAAGGELVLTTSQAGANFYIGNHPGADGRYQPLRRNSITGTVFTMILRSSARHWRSRYSRS